MLVASQLSSLPISCGSHSPRLALSYSFEARPSQGLDGARSRTLLGRTVFEISRCRPGIKARAGFPLTGTF